MKNSILVLLFAGIFFQAMPQKGQLGIQVSPIVTLINNTRMNSNNNSFVPEELMYAPTKFGFKLGINYNYVFKKDWSLTPSLSYSQLTYAFKQSISDAGLIATYSDKLSYGSFELSVIASKYLKINENQYFAFKLGGGFATNSLMITSSSGSVIAGSSGPGSSSSYDSNGFNRTYTPRIIAGFSIINTLKGGNKLELGLTYNHSFNPVSTNYMTRSVNDKQYSTFVSPVLSFISLDIIYYFKPFKGKKG